MPPSKSTRFITPRAGQNATNSAPPKPLRRCSRLSQHTPPPRGRSPSTLVRYLSAVPDPHTTAREPSQLCLPLGDSARPAAPASTQHQQSSPTAELQPLLGLRPQSDALVKHGTVHRMPRAAGPAPRRAAEKSPVDVDQRRIARLMQIADQVAGFAEIDPWLIGEVGFVSSAMLQCTLPHTCPDPSLPAWGRTSGTRSLIMQQGYFFETDKLTGVITPRPLGYPFGTIPRFILAWLGKEAVRTRSREIVLGKSLTEFMDALGIASEGGGPRSGRVRVREQMLRLFNARIALLNNVGANCDVNWSSASWQVADRTQMWWQRGEEEEASGAHELSRIMLSESFYEELVARPVPLDMRVLRELSRSVMALDIYSWMTLRAYSTRKRTVIPWASLQAQFGSDCSTIYKFKQLFLRALHLVSAAYPQARFEADNPAGFILLPMATAIAKRPLELIEQTRASGE